MDISVIIPIYNAGDYLAPCLSSVKTAIEGLEAEVFLIDDGSTDQSSSVAEAAAQQDPRFRYTRTENRGVSAARNTGAEMASGRYLRFVDADDLVEPGSLSEMVQAADREKSDVAICRMARIKGKRILAPVFLETSFAGVTAGPIHLFSCPTLLQSSLCTNILISRDFFTREKLLFAEGRIFEDIMWTPRVYCRANQVSVIQKIGYLWRIREDGTPSITQHRTDLANLDEKLFAITDAKRTLEREAPDSAKSSRFCLAVQNFRQVEILHGVLAS